jgi:hypothetical protein
MQKHSRAVKPEALGIIGKDHLASRFATLGCDMDTFKYRRDKAKSGLPWVTELAFAQRQDAGRRLITGVNWSPGINDPFTQLGPGRGSLGTLLQQLHSGRDEPIAVLIHIACPRLEYTDHGKGSLILTGKNEDGGCTR